MSRSFRVVAVGVAALLLSGCGAAPHPAASTGSSAGAPEDSFTGQAAAAAQPIVASVTADSSLQRLRGSSFATIRVGSSIVAPPMGYYPQGGTSPVGFEIDLVEAIGKKLGSKVEIQNAQFPTLITGLTSRRFDLLISQMNDNAERQKQIDFVDYYKASVAFVVQKGNPAHVSDAKSLCGRSVSALPGSSQLAWARSASSTVCRSGTAITVVQASSEQAALSDLRTGRQVANLSDTALAGFTAQSGGGSFQAVVPPQQIDPAPYGIGIRKTDSPLRNAVEKALQSLIDDGTYGKLAKTWQVQGGSVPTATINAGS